MTMLFVSCEGSSSYIVDEEFTTAEMKVSRFTATVPMDSEKITQDILKNTPEPVFESLATISPGFFITRTTKLTSIGKETKQVTTFPTIEPPKNPIQSSWIEMAKQDLVGRLNINLDEIELIEFRNVVWPDADLGCPNPEVVHKQVQVEGYLIRLQVGKRIFQYHGGGHPDKQPFLCENPVVPEDPLPPPGFGDQ